MTLTRSEHALLEGLAIGPRTPAELKRSTDVRAVSRALTRLERHGLARMTGSNEQGPWMLTPAGRAHIGRRS